MVQPTEVVPDGRASRRPRSGGAHDLVRYYIRLRVDGGQLAPSTATCQRLGLHAFFDSTGQTDPKKVTRHDVETWVRRPGLKPDTRRRELSLVRTFYAWLILERRATTNPTAGIPPIRVPRGLPRGLRPEQVARLLDIVPDARARLVVLLEVQCALRTVEVTRLHLEDIDLSERTIWINGKGGHERLLPVPAEAWEALVAYLAEWPATSGPLVRGYPQTVAAGKGVSPAHVVDMIGTWMANAGISESGHSLRHTCASDLLKRGVHVRDVQAMLGHCNIAITSRYLPTNVAPLRQAMEGRTYRLGPATAAGAAVETDVDAIPALIDTVAALAVAVARLEARLAMHGPGCTGQGCAAPPAVSGAAPGAVLGAPPGGPGQDLSDRSSAR